MNSQQSRLIATALAHRAGRDADAAQIADAIVSTWHEIVVALTPIVGQLGVAALYRRSVYLSAQAHPWLLATHEGVHTAMDLEMLKSRVAKQSSASATDAGGVMLQTFYELLASLVGASLTERLLRSVWATFASGVPAQENSR